MDSVYSILFLAVLGILGSKAGFIDREAALEQYMNQIAGANSPSKDPKPEKVETTLFGFDDIHDPTYRARSFYSEWISDQNHTLAYVDDYSNLVSHDPVSGVIEILVSNMTFLNYSSWSYYLNSDASYILLAYEQQQVWRHSFTAKYVIIDTSDNNQRTDLIDGETLQYAGWAPVGNAMTIVVGNDVWYQANVTEPPIQVTTDGDIVTRFNGIPDWLYEEDVLSSRVAHYWSPDAVHIAYATFDDSAVSVMRYPFYGPSTDIYGQTVQIAYPKAGSPDGSSVGSNTKVTMTVVNTQTLDFYEINPPQTLIDAGDYYYTRASWLSNSELIVTWTNRIQNEAYVYIYTDFTDGGSVPGTQIANIERTEEDGWIDSPWPMPHSVEKYSSYVTVLPQLIENQGDWMHVAHVQLSNAGFDIDFLTSGQHEVQYVASVDDENDVVYFITTGGDPKNRHLYRVPLSGNSTEECMTCDFDEDVCAYVSVSMSPDHSHYMLTCSGPDVPNVSLYSIDGTLVNVFEDNSALKEALELKALPTRVFDTIDLGDGQVGEAEIFYPPDHVEGEAHPLLIYAYAGPGSQRVTRTFPMGSSIANWLTFLKSTHRVVVASVDSRGAAGKGQLFRYLMYRVLGTVEVEDQMLAASYLKNQDYIDSTANAAIFGWSYGGQTSAHALANDSSPYQCGISVAPVTTKEYYDTAYTERYMALDTPEDNAAGYDGTSVMNKAHLFKDKKYLIAHGTDDDNVHFQHFAQLVKALVQNEVQFRQLVYVDENHSILNYNANRHLFQALTNFLLEDCGWENTGSDEGDGNGDGTGGGDNSAGKESLLVYMYTISIITLIKILY